MDIALAGNSILRYAIKHNLVSFPSQIPNFTKPRDTHERIAQLYFIRGWRMRIIGDRYGLSKQVVRRWLSEWRIRAIAAGYIQEIYPELLASLVNEEDVHGQEVLEQSSPDSDFAGLVSPWETALPRRAVSTGAHP
jgi:hypothetical protein